MSWAAIVFTFALVDNAVLSRLLGLPAVQPSGNPPSPGRGGSFRDSAWWLGGSMTVLMGVSALAASVLNTWVLVPLGLTLLRTPVMVFLVVGFAMALQAAMHRVLPGASDRHGVSVLRLGVNCVALGLVLVTTRAEYGPMASLLAGASAGAGYLIATALMGAIRERLEVEPVPPSLRGLPLQLITAGLMAYAFMAFDRAFLARLLGA